MVRVPHDVKHGDVVRLRVRAESAAEIEAWTAEDERAKTAGLGRDSSKDSPGDGQNPVGVSSRGDPVRSATLKLGSYEGVLRARVADRGSRVAMYRQALRGATTLEAPAATEDETKATQEETKSTEDETKVDRGGDQVDRGGDQSDRAGDQGDRAGDQSDQGGGETKPPESTRARIDDDDDQETAAAKVDAAVPENAHPKPGRMSLIATDGNNA